MFNSFVRSLTRALRTLLEVTSLNMLLRHDARRARDDLLDVNLSLPFQTEVNTGFGVLAKVYLDALTHINGRQRVRDANAEGVREAKAVALDICEETFQGVKNPKAEVERGFRFWDVVSAVSCSITLTLFALALESNADGCSFVFLSILFLSRSVGSLRVRACASTKLCLRSRCVMGGADADGHEAVAL